MSLDVAVGVLADLVANDEEGAGCFREDLERLNVGLLAAGLERHVEPETAPLLSLPIGSYSTLHELRRVAAHLQYSDKPPLSRPMNERSWDDALYDRYFAAFYEENPESAPSTFAKPSARRFDHLMVHSDAEGFYVPQQFDSVLVTGANVYGWVGSSFALASECEELARALQIPEAMLLDKDDMVFVDALRALERPPSLGRRIGGFFKSPLPLEVWRQLPIAASVCVKLHQAAQHSMRTGAVIAFQ